MPHVKVLSNYGVGLDNIDLAAAEEKGVIVKIYQMKYHIVQQSWQ